MSQHKITVLRVVVAIITLVTLFSAKPSVLAANTFYNDAMIVTDYPNELY